MKYLFFDLPVYGRIENSTAKKTEDILRECGGNTGNLMFRHAISRHINDTLIPTHWKDGETLAVEHSVDGVVLAAANWLNTSHSFGNEKRAAILKRLQLPTICIGLGCQHDVAVSHRLSFPPETVDFLDVLKDLNALVLVRDQFTLEQCQLHGLENVFATGCPSNFINTDPQFGEKLINKAKQHPENVTLNRGYCSHDILRHDNALMEFVYQSATGRFVVQTDDDHILRLAMDRIDEVGTRRLAKIRSNYGIPRWFGGRSRLEQFRDRLTTYLDVESWMGEASSWDFVVGTRIHGAMAALQAATPAVLTTIDSRTEGLARQMAVPYVPLNDIAGMSQKLTPSVMKERAIGTVDNYLKRREVLMKTYIGHLQSFGLEISKELLDAGEKHVG